jgi:hypothetical protein
MELGDVWRSGLQCAGRGSTDDNTCAEDHYRAIGEEAAS